MDTNCKLDFKRDNIFAVTYHNSLVDYQVPCPSLTLLYFVTFFFRLYR